MGHWEFVEIKKDPAGTKAWAIIVERKTTWLERKFGAKDSVEMYIGRSSAFRNSRTGELAGLVLGTWLAEIVWKHKRRIKMLGEDKA